MPSGAGLRFEMVIRIFDKDQEPDCLLMRLAVDHSGEEQGEQDYAGKNNSHIQMLPDPSSVSVKPDSELNGNDH